MSSKIVLAVLSILVSVTVQAGEAGFIQQGKKVTTFKDGVAVEGAMRPEERKPSSLQKAYPADVIYYQTDGDVTCYFMKDGGPFCVKK